MTSTKVMAPSEPCRDEEAIGPRSRCHRTPHGAETPSPKKDIDIGEGCSAVHTKKPTWVPTKVELVGQLRVDVQEP